LFQRWRALATRINARSPPPVDHRQELHARVHVQRRRGAWLRRWDTVAMETPAASISVAMKWRRSCSRKCGRPAASRAAMNRLVSQFGSHGFPPSGRELNTNASAVSSAPASRARSFAQARCAVRTSSVSASSSTRYVRWVLVERSSGPLGPSIRARVKAIAARSSSTLPHRRASRLVSGGEALGDLFVIHQVA